MTITMNAAAPSHPPVTVLTAVYNGEQYLAEAIESVLAQTHRDFEYIILNDGSNDATEEIARHYAAADSRIKVLSHPNMGMPRTLNRGLEAASGTWVAIIDHDDICLPTRLERQLAAATERPHVKVWGTYAWRIGPDGQRYRIIRHSSKTTEAEYDRVRASNEILSIIHPTAFMHRETVLGLGGYDPELKGAADTDLWSRVADDHPILVIPEPLVGYRLHGSSMMATQVIEMEQYLRWIALRQQCRRAGKPMPDLAAFQRSEASLPLRRRVSFWWRDHAAVALRRAYLAKFQGDRLGMVRYGIQGAVMRPIWVSKWLRDAATAG
jgi:glycosyltransferase involved in cell wall biosynthesis